ncbi:cbb3-type cytochrome c oxidase subunit I [Flavihumibacter rivuli]|uniref:cbb3-type cytochrome c oxidase subunit I n=1 Tax=Flavihumibacter rivuli TaxID=2838156 RepID=UPI001BDE448B|nr:cbb3-type cytochrome c oxidase subunit I [Flavihumibacter rivuli]ULQ58312.1 cbb3-type cytochrome c oxidase subunit I [Flavihumibacter rivuli]
METRDLFTQSGIIITLLLILLPVLTAVVLIIIKANSAIKEYKMGVKVENFNTYLKRLSIEEINQLKRRQEEQEYSLNNNELGSNLPPADKKGLIHNIIEEPGLHFIETKKKAQPKHHIAPELARLIVWYLACGAFWLIFGTTVGEYLGIKFSAPDIDHISWLSFGRLRPVHTNAVFWGWASISMMGLAYYVVPRISNTAIHHIKWGYHTLVAMNAAVIIGTISLMAGINNGGGEYREYTWPVMCLFGYGIVLSLVNFLRTISKRTTNEIYVSNWYIISALMFLLVIVGVAYLPTWQKGLGETIIQGYYMHQGVGMWFMLFCLGLMYYFLPQQLNKPIYSYGLGILAFWAQILFYTLIGTHHFIFSAIPWWLQTVAIIGSAGMLIPVIAGTTNFILTFNGTWNKVAHSYTLPFYLTGIIFYFTGSLQGTVEAFRFTNLLWHFTDFTVAHSHLTMYGIITFMLWAFIYTLVPRLTGHEPSHIAVGIHFWLALIGLLFYTIPLMIGATFKGLSWMDGKPFMESVVLMKPYWLWRAIGGSLMWLSHLVFIYNFYRMVKGRMEANIPTTAKDILKAKEKLETATF